MAAKYRFTSNRRDHVVFFLRITDSFGKLSDNNVVVSYRLIKECTDKLYGRSESQKVYK